MNYKLDLTEEITAEINQEIAGAIAKKSKFQAKIDSHMSCLAEIYDEISAEELEKLSRQLYSKDYEIIESYDRYIENANRWLSQGFID